MSEISVLLVDDHALVRKGFRRILEDDPQNRVVDEAANGQEAIRLARRLHPRVMHPRVIVMDMAMPGLDGVQATREIVKNQPDIAVLILSMYSEENYVRNALDAGARGYMLKEALDVDLAGAVKALAAGRQVIGPGVRAPTRAPDPRYDRLTPREKQILELAAQGQSNKTIAALLHLSENTVAVHRVNLMAELGFHRTAELIVWAAGKGLVRLP
jgi:DNA-binding NarL/FixJ family response regulator